MNTNDDAALVELRAMLAAISRDAPDFFAVGKTRFKRRLFNGYTVTVNIQEGSGRAALRPKVKTTNVRTKRNQ